MTGRAGLVAWEQAFAAMTGGAPFPPVRPDGLTDHQIAAWLLEQADRDGAGRPTRARAPAGARVDELVARYERALHDALPLRQGRVLDHVGPVLEWLRRERPHVLCWLVTGNTRTGGAAKLRHYGLDVYFRPAAARDTAMLEGCFSERVEPRANILRRALARARDRVPGLAASEALVIGDTPHDIEGARQVGVPVLAVATNVHTFDDLAAHRPWLARPTLPDVLEFARLLDHHA